MNERIRALAVLAGAYSLAPSQDSFGEWFAGGLVVRDMDVNQFSELLAQECMECVRDVLRDEASDLTYDGADQVQRRIRQVFGIQE